MPNEQSPPKKKNTDVPCFSTVLQQVGDQFASLRGISTVRINTGIPMNRVIGYDASDD